VQPGPLGLIPPIDDKHKVKFPLSAALAETMAPASGAFGIPWWSAFDAPIMVDGRWMIGVEESGKVKTNLGFIRGGHAIMAPAKGSRDASGWYAHYNQTIWPSGDTRASSCVGQSVCRVASHNNRKRYDPIDVYLTAKQDDEWPGEAYDGTSLRAGFEVLRVRGPRIVRRGRAGEPIPGEGILVYRWCLSVEDILASLGYPVGQELVPLHQSWGPPYPRKVWLPVELADRVVFREDGEYGTVTDL
jgi:hypothetical protein